MWEFAELDDRSYNASLKRLSKKNPDEVAELFAHLKELCSLVNSGMPVHTVLQKGFVHHKYKKGMKSIATGKRGKAALRLYFYPDVENSVFVILGINDKSKQNDDVQAVYKILDIYKRQM